MKPSPLGRGMPERCIEITLKNKVRCIPSIAGEGELLLLLFFFFLQMAVISVRRGMIYFWQTNCLLAFTVRGARASLFFPYVNPFKTTLLRENRRATFLLTIFSRGPDPSFQLHNCKLKCKRSKSNVLHPLFWISLFNL